MEKNKIKILVVDDSSVSRELMTHLLTLNPDFEVIDTAANGVEALEIIEKTPPDLVITDIVMPKMNGFELTKKIMELHPMPIIVVSGVYSREEIQKSFEAIDAGALAILEKPRGFSDAQFTETARFIMDTFNIMSQIQRSKTSRPYIQPKFQEELSFQHIDVIGIGSSLGGPRSLRKVLGDIPPTIKTSILIVQHIFPGFVQGFVDWLGSCTKLKVQVAKNGEKILPAHIYIIPDDVIIEVLPGGFLSVFQDTTQTENKVRSIGRLFRSLGNVYGNRSMGVLLSGHNKETEKDLAYMKEKGAITIAESLVDIKGSGLKQENQSATTIDDIIRLLHQVLFNK